MAHMQAEPFQVAARAGANARFHILTVSGAITTLTSPAFLEAALAASAPALIIGLSETFSVDSMAVGALERVSVSRNKSGRTLALVPTNHRVINVLKITGVDLLFEIYPAVPEAESALR